MFSTRSRAYVRGNQAYAKRLKPTNIMIKFMSDFIVYTHVITRTQNLRLKVCGYKSIAITLI